MYLTFYPVTAPGELLFKSSPIKMKSVIKRTSGCWWPLIVRRSVDLNKSRKNIIQASQQCRKSNKSELQSHYITVIDNTGTILTHLDGRVADGLICCRQRIKPTLCLPQPWSSVWPRQQGLLGGKWVFCKKASEESGYIKTAELEIVYLKPKVLLCCNDTI